MRPRHIVMTRPHWTISPHLADSIQHGFRTRRQLGHTPISISNRAKATLHNPQERLAAGHLATVCRPTVPRAEISLLDVTMDGLEAARDKDSIQRADARLSERKVVLLATCGADSSALALAYNFLWPLCGALSIYGNNLPISAAPAVGSVQGYEMPPRLQSC